jgi:hypothetical protein
MTTPNASLPGIAASVTPASVTPASVTPASGSDRPAPPRDFALLLPPGWIRISIDGREGARATALATAKVSDLPEPQRSAVRERLLQIIKTALHQARQAGGVDILMSLAEAKGVPIAASCLVSYVDQGDAPIPMDLVADDLSHSDEGGDVSLGKIAGRHAVRHRHVDPPLTRLDYMMTMPGKPGMLTFAFATPMEMLADPLVVLFDAMMSSLRWIA